MPAASKPLAPATAFALAMIRVAFAETVNFPGRDLALRGELFHSAGPGPFPAVVATRH